MLMATVAGAVTVNFDFTTGYANQQEPATVTNSGVSITFGKGGSNIAPVWLESASSLRVYAKNTMSFTCSSEIESIEFSFRDDKTFNLGTGADPQLTSGEYAEQGLTGTWTGEATALTITAGGAKGHARITAIDVTIKGDAPEGTVPNPVISPASAAFSESQLVEISCADPEASIYYTLDASTPSTASTLYTEPFTVTQTVTVKAIAVKGEAVSQVVTAQLNLIEGVDCIADYLALPEGTTMVFNCPVTVVAQYDKHLFVQDEWGMGMRIFGSTGHDYEFGDIIPAGFTGTKSLYGGEPELSVFFTNYFQEPTEWAEPIPTVLDAVDVDWRHHAEYVMVRNVQLAPGDGEDDFFMYNLEEDYGMGYVATLHVPLPDDLTPRYDVFGVVSSHYTLNTVYQLCPIKFVVHGDVNDDKQINVGDVAAIYNIILGEIDSTQEEFLCDLNGDGQVNVGDVAAAYDQIVSQ